MACKDETKTDLRKKHKDIEIGDKYGYWIVIKQGVGRLYSNGKDKGKSLKRSWICQCTCENCNAKTEDVVEKLLKNGSSRGCLLSYDHRTNLGQYKDLTGKVYGKLTVISFYKREGRNTLWNCDCECGNTKIISTNSLNSGNCNSCGCIDKYKTHGLSLSRLYRIYGGMKSRCFYKKHMHYDNYGGRGITICDEWLDSEDGFINFYNWAVHNGYKDDLSIDRNNNDGNYEPSNCSWENTKKQRNNCRNSHIVTAFGQEKTIQQWCDEIDIKYTTLAERLRRGWATEKAISTPVKKKEKKKA